MPVVKHLYVLTYGSTRCTCGLLTVTLPVVIVHVLGIYMGEAWAMGGGYVSMYGLCNRSGFVGV